MAMMNLTAFPNYSVSREHIVLAVDGQFIGYVDAWTGSKYWPVHDSRGRTIAHVRRELGGLYAPEAAESESIRWAAEALVTVQQEALTNYNP